MSDLMFADTPMAGMMPMSQGLLPPWVTWLWLVALAAVLVFHCGHFVRMGGQPRWYHSSHILMLVSMLYMYASMEFKWTWLSHSLQAGTFSMSTAAWLAGLLDDTKPAMAVGPSSHGLGGSLPYGSMSERGSMSFGPGDRAVDVPLAQNTLTARVSLAIMAASMAYMFAAMQLMR